MQFFVQRMKCSADQAQICNIEAVTELDALRLYCEKYSVSVGTSLHVAEDKFFGAKKWYYIVDSKNPFTARIVDESTVPDQNQRLLDEDKENAREAFDDVIVTTAQSLEGHFVIETLDIVSAECVLGTNIFSDIAASFSDVFGGRSGSSQGKLREARRTCIMELKKEAFSIGANAIIAIDLDYSEISGGGKSMLFIVANGTAVRVVKNETYTKNEFKSSE